ncbi:hypothetical protein [Mycoplasma sp. 1012]
MRTKDKILIVFLTIITLGFIWIYWKNKSKNKTENQLSKSYKTSINVTLLIELLGKKENINKIENSHKKIKIYLNNTKLVKAEEIQKLKGISGVLVSSTYVNLIVGNVAEYLKTEIENIMK